MKKITNYVDYRTLCSDLVYPDWTNRSKWKQPIKVSADLVKAYMRKCYNCDDIGNKYAVQLVNGVIWYKHDDSYWQLEAVDYLHHNPSIYYTIDSDCGTYSSRKIINCDTDDKARVVAERLYINGAYDIVIRKGNTNEYIKFNPLNNK